MPPLDLIAWLLIALWAVLLFGGFLLGRDPTHMGRIPRWARLISSFVLVVLAWYGYALAGAPFSVRYAGLVAGGMTLGFAGDLFMGQVLPAPNRVLAGMAAFGLGHVLYISAIASYAPINWIALLVWLMLGGLLFYFFVFHSREHPFLRRAAVPYALLLAATAGMATGLAFQQSLFIGLAVGAALFFVSDLFIAVDLFDVAHLPYTNDIIWLTYGPAQALIVTSIWSTFQPHTLL